MLITVRTNMPEGSKQVNVEDLSIIGNKTEEREITISSTADEKVIHIYTSDNTYLTKIKKRVLANPSAWRIIKIIERRDGTITGVMAEAPKNALSFRTVAERDSTGISDAQKEALRVRLENYREKRSKKI